MSTNMNDSTNAGPEVPADDMWKDFKLATSVATEAPTTAHPTIEIEGHNVNVPLPPPSKREPQEVGGRHRKPQETGGKGKKSSGQQKGKAGGSRTWRPVLQTQSTSDQHAHDESHVSSRFASSGSHGKGGKDQGKDKTKGGKSRPKETGKPSGSGKGFDQGGSWSSKGKGNRYHGEQVAYLSTGIYGHVDTAWEQLQDAYPDQYNPAMTEFWQDGYGDWLVRSRYD